MSVRPGPAARRSGRGAGAEGDLGLGGLLVGDDLQQAALDAAARTLRDTSKSLETIARSVRYTSAYAFDRAFSRSRSESPGRYQHRMAHHLALPGKH